MARHIKASTALLHSAEFANLDHAGAVYVSLASAVDCISCAEQEGHPMAAKDAQRVENSYTVCYDITDVVSY